MAPTLLILTGAGTQRMASRTYAALLASEGGTMGARELAGVLNVSPAAISGSVRYLEQVQLIRRGRDPGARPALPEA